MIWMPETLMDGLIACEEGFLVFTFLLVSNDNFCWFITIVAWEEEEARRAIWQQSANFGSCLAMATPISLE